MKYAALLRGVNIGSNRRVPMGELRQLLAGAGFDAVATYLQSGNAVFGASGSRQAVREKVEEGIAEQFGIDVRVVLVTASELGEIIDGCPYRAAAEADPTKVHVIFFDRMPPARVWSEIDVDAADPEQLSVGHRAVYMHLPNGMGRAVLPSLMEKSTSSVVATTRNWRTVVNVAQLLEA